jgi:hypothetical protein
VSEECNNFLTSLVWILCQKNATNFLRTVFHSFPAPAITFQCIFGHTTRKHHLMSATHLDRRRRSRPRDFARRAAGEAP